MRRSSEARQECGQPRAAQPQEAQRALDRADLARQVGSPYLTASEAVAYLKLGSLSALYRLIREWNLPYGRVGRSYRFHRGALDRWVEKRGVEPLAMVRSA